MKQDKKYKHLLQDLISILKLNLDESKEREKKSKSEGDRLLDYNLGVTMGIYMCMSLIKYQAEAFLIPLKEIGLDDYPLDLKALS